MARPLTAEALRAELKTFLEMRDESVITEEEFANLKQEAIARFQRQPAADPNVPEGPKPQRNAQSLCAQYV